MTEYAGAFRQVTESGGIVPTALNGSHVKCTDPDHHGCPLCTAPADAHLEAAMRKLRANTGEFKPRLLWAEAAALLARLEAADRWNAIMSCKRIRVLGAAGLDDDGDYARIGLELWSTYPMAPLPDGYDIEDRRLLTKFAERAAYRNPQPAKEGE